MPNKPSAVIFANNQLKLVNFYSQLVPMTVLQADQLHTVLDSEAMQLVIHAIPNHIAAQFQIKEPSEVRTEMPIKLCIPILSLEKAREEAEGLGGLVYPLEYEWLAGSFRACDGYDPEGNVIQFREKMFDFQSSKLP